MVLSLSTRERRVGIGPISTTNQERAPWGPSRRGVERRKGRPSWRHFDPQSKRIYLNQNRGVGWGVSVGRKRQKRERLCVCVWVCGGIVGVQSRGTISRRISGTESLRKSCTLNFLFLPGNPSGHRVYVPSSGWTGDGWTGRGCTPTGFVLTNQTRG